MEALRQGASVIRSRNRYPEATAMAALNRRLSAVVVNSNPHDYGGEGLVSIKAFSCSRA